MPLRYTWSMLRPSLSLALGLTLAVSAACAKHEKAQQQAAAEPAIASNATATAAATPPPQDPKEAARASGLLGPTDQGAFADDFDGGSAGSAAAKPIAKGKGSSASSGKKSDPKVNSASSGGGPGGPAHQGANLDDLSGGGGPKRGGQKINGSVAIADVSAGDDSAKDAVRAAVAAHLGAIEACYRDTLSRAPTVAGKFDVVFFVERDGAFDRAAQLSSELGDGLLRDCIIKTVNGIKLDHAVGGTQPIKVGVVLSFKHT